MPWGTRPRIPSVGQDRLILHHSGAGAPELQSPAPNLANLVNLVNPAPVWLGEGQALALRAEEGLVWRGEGLSLAILQPFLNPTRAKINLTFGKKYRIIYTS